MGTIISVTRVLCDKSERTPEALKRVFVRLCAIQLVRLARYTSIAGAYKGVIFD